MVSFQFRNMLEEKKNMHAMRHENTSLSMVGEKKIVRTLWGACFPLFWHSHSSGLSSCLPSFFFIILFIYWTAISTFWVTELIVPAHALSADSIIRHSGQPEKKKKGGKRGMLVQKCGRVKNEGWKAKRMKHEKRSQIREGKVERESKKKKMRAKKWKQGG